MTPNQQILDRITEVLNLPDASGKGLALTGKGYMLLYRIRKDLGKLLNCSHIWKTDASGLIDTCVLCGEERA